jgi:hypothetical protein
MAASRQARGAATFLSCAQVVESLGLSEEIWVEH